MQNSPRETPEPERNPMIQATLIDHAVAAARAGMPRTLEQLTALVRIPSCSFPGYDPAQVVASAQATAEWLRTAGYPEVRVVELPGCPHPYVLAADRRAGPGKPTVLLYAHHDVQPPLRLDRWTSPPHAPEVRDGRLYGRGAADDKAGIAAHAGAQAAWVATAGGPPVNVVVLIEGEEEIGSPNFTRFLAAHRQELQADCVVIADLANVALGLPSLTTSLRGNLVLEVELSALAKPLHSGMWGGAVPDPVQALCKLVAGLMDETGAIRVPGVNDRVRPLTAVEEAGFARIPFDPAVFAAQAGLKAGTAGLVNADGAATHAALWRRPSLTVNAIQAGTRGQTGNVVMDAAWARLSVRLVPDQDPAEVERLLVDHLHAHAPAWATLTITGRGSGGRPWATATDHPLFATAREALRQGYGVAPVEIGCGASIPFVGDIVEALGGVPAILIGVEDPACGAHAEDESVPLADLESAIAAETAFLGLLARG